MLEKLISIQEALDYELHGSWWVRNISNNRLQNLAARYFVWKVQRKHARYSYSRYQRRAMQRMGFLPAARGTPVGWPASQQAGRRG